MPPWDWWEVLGQVRVGPFRHVVTWMTKAEAKKHGDPPAFFIGEECRVGIRENLDTDAMRECLLHEVLHACIQVSGLDNDEAEEAVIRAISPTLLDTLQRNPKLVKYLIKGE